MLSESVGRESSSLWYSWAVVCVFLSYACAAGWVGRVFHDGGGGLGCNWYSLLLFGVQFFCVVWGQSILVFVVLGCQERCEYERMRLMYCLYT